MLSLGNASHETSPISIARVRRFLGLCADAEIEVTA